jgi:putative molybdopterin biosynthesis protein
VLERASLEDPVLAPFWELLESPAFRSAVEELGGYGAAEMGRRIR